SLPCCLSPESLPLSCPRTQLKGEGARARGFFRRAGFCTRDAGRGEDDGGIDRRRTGRPRARGRRDVGDRGGSQAATGQLPGNHAQEAADVGYVSALRVRDWGAAVRILRARGILPVQLVSCRVLVDGWGLRVDRLVSCSYHCCCERSDRSCRRYDVCWGMYTVVRLGARRLHSSPREEKKALT
ncbi:unnamed protein product, partial [Ectocarpus sp. 4 AP-2014]